MYEAALFVWSLVVGLSATAVKETGTAWSVGILAFSVCVFISLIYLGVVK